MEIREITEGVMSLSRAAESIISLHQNSSDNEAQRNLLYRMAENEQMRWLLTQYWEANVNNGVYIKSKANIQVEKYKKALDIMNYWRKMRQLRDQTEQNIRSL